RSDATTLSAYLANTRPVFDAPLCLTPAALEWAPTLAASFINSAAALPPEGELFAPWGGPAALICAPTLASSLRDSAAALPPEGELFAPWGGPATLMSRSRSATR